MNTLNAKDAEVARRTLNELSHEVIAAALKVHSKLGPGLLESAYQSCFVFELRNRGMHAETEVGLPVVYEGHKVDLGYRIDILVQNELVIELKAIETILPVHKAQLLSHVRLSGRKLGLLINFNVAHLRDGITRVVNNF
jgi:GxxExxY protein